jgi:hypothetical protein
MQRARELTSLVVFLVLAGAAGGVPARAADVAPGPGESTGVRPRGIPIRSVRESDWSGPRIGFMFAPGDAQVSRRLRDNGLGSVVSLFGWHFEHLVTPGRGGPRLVTEITPVFAGVEYGKVVPSVTLCVGVRSREGYEIGMGPSLRPGFDSEDGSVALVIAGGRSLDLGDVCIPFNVAISTNPKGTMVSALVGYAIPRAGR